MKIIHYFCLISATENRGKACGPTFATCLLRKHRKTLLSTETEKKHEYKEKITLMREKKESLAPVCSYFKHLLPVAMEIVRHDGASLARCHTKANGVENSILKNLGSRVIKSNQVKEMERFLYKIGVD